MLLEVKNLTAGYGTVTALKNISFNVKEGEIVAMIGPNGAGKSIALNSVSGVLKAKDGSISSGEFYSRAKALRGCEQTSLLLKGYL